MHWRFSNNCCQNFYEMKKLIYIIILLFAFVVTIYLILRIGWSFNDTKVLNVYILDKTVNTNDRLEHKSFTWLLNNNRYLKPNHKNYSYSKDYYGFFPVDIENEVFDFKSIRINEVETYAENYDVAYYTDCYGVYSFEWYKGKTKPIRSQKVYGGLNQNDYLLMKNMIESGKLIIAEFNMFSTPTNALVRSKTEDLLGISWSGWSGKYFVTLNVDDENGPDEWMKNLYESQHLGVWPNNQSGIVLLNNDGLIEVLVNGKHLNSSLPSIKSTDDMVNRFHVANDIPYEQWFEFIKPGNNKVSSSFNIDATDEGIAIFDKLGLSNSFPAIIEGSSDKKFFYFCGDFAENPVQIGTAKLLGGRWINHFIYRFNASNRANFFRYYYSPLIDGILEEHYNSKDN